MSFAALALCLIFADSGNADTKNPELWKIIVRDQGIRLASLHRQDAMDRRWISPIDKSLDVNSIGKRRTWLTVEKTIDEKTLLVQLDGKRVALRRFPDQYSRLGKRFVEIAYCCTHEESFEGYGKLLVLEMIPVPLFRAEIKRLEKL